MSKQLLQFSPQFIPGAANAGYLDFSSYPNFTVNKLYAVINITRNAPLFVAGAPGYGLYAITGGNLTLQVSTSTYSSGDVINVFYDTAPSTNSTNESNQVSERGGQIQDLQESINQILVELKVQNFILAQGLNINIDDIQSIRNDVNRIENQASTY